MSTSGGWTYHWRAFRFQNREWRNHLDSVHDFLESWWDSQRQPRLETLILVGPSGGYSLPRNFLNRFSHIIAYEPDAWARKIFEYRFPEVRSKISWKSQGYDFSHDLPAGMILFCNLLGQIEIADVSEFQSRLNDRLKGRVWASYHDALSGNHVRLRIPTFQQAKSDPQKWKTWIQTRSTRPIELVAHLAPDLFDARSDLRFFYWEWRLTRDQVHLIEGVYHVASA